MNSYKKVGFNLIDKTMNSAQQPEDKFETVLFLPEGVGRQGEGGLRTQGYFKQSQEGKPLITVVTVVFNGEKFLEETILSVINQTYDNVEYIIIDGGSTDGTLDIIKKYEHVIDYWVSEKDKGIYDAMNKGIDVATGEWINFMNAGDRFYKNETLAEVDFSNFAGVDVLYGKVEVTNSRNKITIQEPGRLKNLWKGSQFSHQAAFISTRTHKKIKYKSSLKYAADFNFFYILSTNGYFFKKLPYIFAKVIGGGVSDTNRVVVINEFKAVSCPKGFFCNLFFLYVIIFERIKNLIKKAIY